MSRFDGAPVEARIGDCRCDGGPHPDGDVVYLRPRLTFDGGEAAQEVMMRRAGSAFGLPEDSPELGAALRVIGRELVEAYLRHQVLGWNLMNGVGPLPYDPELLLSDWEAAKAVGDVADDLYSEGVTRPLVQTVSALLPPGPMEASTSPSRPSSRKRRKR